VLWAAQPRVLPIGRWISDQARVEPHVQLRSLALAWGVRGSRRCLSDALPVPRGARDMEKSAIVTRRALKLIVPSAVDRLEEFTTVPQLRVSIHSRISARVRSPKGGSSTNVVPWAPPG
jgi:hypothetical protein